MPERQSGFPWGNSDAARAWLEQRYPLGDASLGSPLYRHMLDVWELDHGRDIKSLAMKLTWEELHRWISVYPDFAFTYAFTEEKLYPNFGEPTHLPRPLTPPWIRPPRKTDRRPHREEPKWTDMEASRIWLEERYPLDLVRPALGSPLFRYMKGCYESRNPLCSPLEHLGSMLTSGEWEKFVRHCPNAARQRHHTYLDNILYPEYDNPAWPTQARLAQSPESAKAFTPGWPHVENIPAPAANPPKFTETDPPHLRRQTPSSSPSNKRKSEDEDDAFLEHPANKKQRNRSGLSGGMPPPPRPENKAASAKSHSSAISLGQNQGYKNESSSSRQDSVGVTRTASRPTHSTVVTRTNSPRVLERNRASTEIQEAGPVRQNHRSMDTPETGAPVQTNEVATKSPANTHNGPASIKIKTEHDHEVYSEEGSETADHQPPGQHRKGPTLHNDDNAAREPANKDSSPLRSYPQRENQAPVEENPNAMDIDSDDIEHQTSASPTKILLTDPSRKRGIKEVEDKQPASSPVKKRRTTPEADDESSVISSPPMETLQADSPWKSSVEDIEDASPARPPSQSSQIQSDLGVDRSPISRASTETPRVHPSRKRSIDSVEDAPPTTFSPKRKRTSPESRTSESPPSSPFDPPEQSTPTPFPRLDNAPTANGTRGEIPDPAPSRQQSPSYEDPTTVVFKPHDIEGPALQSGPQPETTDVGRNPEAVNTATAHLRDNEGTLNIDSETQEPVKDGTVPPQPESQGEHRVQVEEDPDDTIIDSGHPREQTTADNMRNGGNRTEQKAIGVLIPSQIPQRRPSANQEFSPDSETTNVHVIQKKREGGRKPGTKRPKAPQSEPQRKQGKHKPLTRGRKNQQSKPEREQQAYVGRLRSGVGERKHSKPRLVVLEFKGRKAVQVKAN